MIENFLVFNMSLAWYFVQKILKILWRFLGFSEDFCDFSKIFKIFGIFKDFPEQIKIFWDIVTGFSEAVYSSDLAWTNMLYKIVSQLKEDTITANSDDKGCHFTLR